MIIIDTLHEDVTPDGNVISFSKARAAIEASSIEKAWNDESIVGAIEEANVAIEEEISFAFETFKLFAFSFVEVLIFALAFIVPVPIVKETLAMNAIVIAIVAISYAIAEDVGSSLCSSLAIEVGGEN